MVKVKESVRKCSQCGLNGHNSRTCHGKGLSIKLFGVRIATEKESDSIRKTQSMVNLTTCHAEHGLVDAGYVSDGLIQSEKARERKKGVPWTEKEHRSFLLGLENLGKGDWRGISKSYVSSRTPTQVASHAQKYFIRMSAKQKKKRRSSLFDMPLKEPSASHHSPSTSPVSPPNPIAEVSQQSGTSPPSPMKSCSESPTQSTSPLQVLKPLEAPQVLPLAAANYRFPPFPHMPYMLGLTSNGQRLPAARTIQPIQFCPVISFPSQVNFCLPRSHGHFSTCSPFVSPMSSDLLQQQLPSQIGTAASVTKKDGLELSIGVK